MSDFVYDISVVLDGVDERGWKIFVITFITAFANYVSSRLLQHMLSKCEATPTPWDNALFYALRRPFGMFIWVMGLYIAARVAYRFEGEVPQDVSVLLHQMRDVLLVICFAWFAMLFIRSVERDVLQEHRFDSIKLDHTTLGAITKLLRITVVITATLMGMQTLGLSISGVLAFGGIGGIAVGFAAKDMLANFFGALMIYFDRPFKVGDWVRSPDRNIEGTVEDIGWRLTKIRTFDKRPLYVPNSAFTTIAIENPSRMTNRRIYEYIGVRYDDVAALDAITTEVKKMLQEHEEIDTCQTLIVNVDRFGASSVDFFIYAFTKTTNWIKFHEIKQDVMLHIERIIAQHDAQIAFPTRTLHVIKDVEDDAAI